MPANSVPCPYCGEPLRVRDRRLIGTTVHCPECKRPLQILSDGPRDVSIGPVPTEKQQSAAQSSKSRIRRQPIPSVVPANVVNATRSVWRRVAGSLSDPHVVAWVVAACMTLLFVTAILLKRNERRGAPGLSNETDNAVTIVEPRELKSDAAAVESLAANQPDEKADVEGASASHATAEQITQPNDSPAELPVVALRPLRIDDAVVDAPPLPADDVSPAAGELVEPVVDDPVVAARPVRGVPPKPVDVAAALALPIVRFEQSTPASIGDLLQQVEEMAGVPIKFDNEELQSASIDLGAKVRLELEGTTVGGILEAVLTQAGLAYQVEEGTIRLRPESSVAPERTSSAEPLSPER